MRRVGLFATRVLMGAVRRQIARIVASVALVAVGCRDREGAPEALPEPPAAWDLHIEGGGTPDGGPWCPVEIGAALALATGPWRFEAGERPHLHLIVGCKPAGRCMDVVVGVGLVVTSRAEPEALFEGAATRKAGCVPWPVSLPFAVAGIAGAIREALAMAYDQYRLVHAPDSEVLQVLEAGRPRGALLQAMVVAGDRGMREAVPLLLRHLDSEDSGVVMRAVGALGRIRDPAALRPLGRVALGTMPDVPHAALQAVADIGGEEARRVLEMVAEQSQSVVVAREARDLLLRLGGGKGK